MVEIIYILEVNRFLLLHETDCSGIFFIENEAGLMMPITKFNLKRMLAENKLFAIGEL